MQPGLFKSDDQSYYTLHTIYIVRTSMSQAGRCLLIRPTHIFVEVRARGVGNDEVVSSIDPLVCFIERLTIDFD